jgi:hypothetical protein
MRMKAVKATALEEINQAGQEAAKATAQLRSEAESFAQKAKDQWANHYARTESSLREKSDKSSAHVATLQSMTGAARKAMLDGQSSAEDAIESWRSADEKATRYNLSDSTVAPVRSAFSRTKKFQIKKSNFWGAKVGVFLV